MIDVYLWLYHTDLWHEFRQALLPIKNKISLHLALCNDNDNSFIINDISSQFIDYKLTYHNNAGADILPFLKDFSNNHNKYSHFLKLHSKKSIISKNIIWRDILLYSLIGNINIFDINYQRTIKNNYGLLSNKNFLLKNKEFTNSNKIIELLNYYNIPINKIKTRQFAAGSMFFGDSYLFESFFNQQTIDFLISKLSLETGHVIDSYAGKYAHSIERLFGYICEYKNKKIGCAIYPTTPIVNSKSPSNKLHLVRTHTSFCYIEENMSVNGTVLYESDNKFIIRWNHLNTPINREYIKLNNANTYIGI